MYVRLAFAVAAHLEPEILLVDEVLAVGDAAFQKKCLGKMGDVAREGRTVLFVSHNMGMIQTLCERALLLTSGAVASEGDPQSVIPIYLNFGQKHERSHFVSKSDSDKSFQILEVSCHGPNGSFSSRFDIASPICVAIKYAVKDELIGSVVSLKIAKEGTILSTSFDTDQFEYLLEIRHPGCYTVNANIPPMLLKPGHYTVSVGTGILNRKRVDYVENAIAFEVDALSVGDSLKSFASKRDGLIIFPIQWNLADD
jgi:lipopolysaccharide transport system ATP-binding protein